METDTDSKILNPELTEPIAPSTSLAKLAAEDNSLAVRENSAHEVNGLQPESNGLKALPVNSAPPETDHPTSTTVASDPQGSLAAQSSTVEPSLLPLGIDPAVKQPVSNIRQPAEPVSADIATEIKESKEQQDLAVDRSLANGLAQGGDAPIERSLTSEVASPPGDDMNVDTPLETATQPGLMNGQSAGFQPSVNRSTPHSIVPSTEDEQMPDAPLQTEQGPEPTAQASGMEIKAAPAEESSGTQRQASEQTLPVQTKVSRPRDDEIAENEPSTKRVKSEGEDDDGSAAPEFKVPDPPVQLSSTSQTLNEAEALDKGKPSEASNLPPPPLPSSTSSALNGKVLLPQPMEREDKPSYRLPITKPQQKHLQRGITNMKKSQHAASFVQPVDYVALNIPTYPDIVKNPMDLKTMDQKLKEENYKTVAEFIADFDQMVTNTLVFNGETHDVTQHAFHLRNAFDRNLDALPSHEYAEPTAAEKKAKKAAVPKPPPRRESRSSLGSAKSPTASSPQTFALGPAGVPLIRRDSTATNDRPKRDIHPPPSKDLPYSASKPKRKKFQQELKFCVEVLNELKKPKYNHISYPFLQPVDPVSLNIPNYHKIIKRPMDISTIDEKLNSGQYENAKEFEADVRLMYQNCYKFNPPDHLIHKYGKEYEKIFDDKWSQKTKWLNEHAPSSEAQSPGSFSEGDEEDDEEDEIEEEEDDNNDQIAELQKSILAISQQIDTLKKGKKKSPPAATKKSKGTKVTKKDSKKPPPKGNKKNPTKKNGQQKVRIMSYDEKRAISDRINELPEARIPQVLQIIRDNMPSLKGAQEEEIELDIDELSDEVLHKLLNFVKKYAPRPEDKVGQAAAATAPSASRPKKNKPMNKAEQEAQIEELRGKLNGLQEKAGVNVGSPGDSSQAVANEDDTSGDDDSEESEED